MLNMGGYGRWTEDQYGGHWEPAPDFKPTYRVEEVGTRQEWRRIGEPRQPVTESFGVSPEYFAKHFANPGPRPPELYDLLLDGTVIDGGFLNDQFTYQKTPKGWLLQHESGEVLKPYWDRSMDPGGGPIGPPGGPDPMTGFPDGRGGAGPSSLTDPPGAPTGNRGLSWPGSVQGKAPAAMPPGNQNGLPAVPEYGDPSSYETGSSYDPMSNPWEPNIQAPPGQGGYDAVMPDGSRYSDTPKDENGWLYSNDDLGPNMQPRRSQVRQPYFDPLTDPGYTPEQGNRNVSMNSPYIPPDWNGRRFHDNTANVAPTPSDAGYYYAPDAVFDPVSGTFTPYSQSTAPMPLSTLFPDW